MRGWSVRISDDDSVFEYAPRYSPDGKSIAYVTWSDLDKGQVWTARANGKGQKQVTTIPGQYANPNWSADGERLVFMSNRDGESRLYVADRDGSNCTLLETQVALAATPGGADDSLSPRWSPSSSAAASTRPPIARGRCARSCSDEETACPPRTRRPGFAMPPKHGFKFRILRVPAKPASRGER